MNTHRPPGYPEYHGSTQAKPTQSYLQQLGGRRAFTGLFDKVAFVLAGIASIWLSVTALIVSVQYAWWAAPLVLIIWGLFAYLTLPRLHRILTTLYVPAYFIGRAQTADGLLGDPINLGLRGESVDIHHAMQNAGWHLAEDVNLSSSWKIIVNTLRGRPYPTAPVSPLFLFDRKEDFAYQQEVDGSPQKRHHVRFWKTPFGWRLPGGIQVDWLAAATFDRAVGLSLFTFQVTHKIDAETDLERDYVVETVKFMNPAAKVEVIHDFSTGYHSRNGGGDSIITDGDLPILELDDVVEEELEIPDNAPESSYSHHRRPWELVKKAPLSVIMASFFISIVAVIQTSIASYRLFVQHEASGMSSISRDLNVGQAGTFFSEYSDYGLIGLLLGAALIQVFLAINVVRGKRWARHIIVVVLLIVFAWTAWSTFWGDFMENDLYTVFVLMAAMVFAMLEFTSDGAVNYTHNYKKGSIRSDDWPE